MPSRILVVDDSPTIRRVVSNILERHGYEPALASDGQDALEALTSGEVRADLVLVDFVMPRMNGFQFCRALRESDDLASTPVVLMSAKGDRIRDQFVQQTGAIDAITKPFDAQALVAVVENALRRGKAPGRASSARVLLDDLGDLDDLSDPTDVKGGVAVTPAEPETRRTDIAHIVAAKLGNLLTRTIAETPSATLGELGPVLASRLANEALSDMVEVVRELQRSDDANGPALAGDLAAVPIGAVLQLLSSEGKTGLLVCRTTGAEVTATFRRGLVDLVQSSGAGDEFRLGRFFVEEGILTPTEIDAVMSEQRGREGEAAGEAADDPVAPRLLGSLLCDVGKITGEQLRSALTRQSSELLYEVLRWPAGRFDFRVMEEREEKIAPTARLGMPVAAVVMEGFRRVDEWRVLERTLGSFDAVLVKDEVALASLDEANLPAKERTVLDAIDGVRTVRAIVRASHASSFDACRVLVQLLEARVLRRRG